MVIKVAYKALGDYAIVINILEIPVILINKGVTEPVAVHRSFLNDRLIEQMALHRVKAQDDFKGCKR